MNDRRLKIAKVLTFVVLLSLITTIARAQNMERAERDWSWNPRERFSYNPSGDKYLANEFTIDLFGSYKRGEKNVGDFFDEPEHGAWGGGLGVNYFFTRMIGIGADTTMHANGGEFFDNVSGNLTLRFPIGTSPFAPYIFGGGGRDFDPVDQWEGHAGIGLEFRLNPRTGIFADGRYAWPDKTGDYSLIRTGLRFVF